MKLGVLFAAWAALLAALPASSFAQEHPAALPLPSELSGSEPQELARQILERFGELMPKDAKYAAAGPYRRASSRALAYAERSDTGSIALESALYGADSALLRADLADPEESLRRVLGALHKAGIDTEEVVFSGFEDEFVASSRGPLPPGTDPRESAVLVSRTARFDRAISGVPIFGSELLAGTLPNGRLGRLRYHAPPIDPGLVRDAETLRQALREGRWQIPETALADGAEILEVEAGVGHSAFATPELHAAAVVRVLLRRTSEVESHRLQSTRHAYFDSEGREVALDAVPDTPGSDARLKGLP